MRVCNNCIHNDFCNVDGYIDADECTFYQNKADFVEVVRCENCKHGDVSVFEKTKDGQERVGCFCNITEKVQTLDWYCPVGEPKNDKE